MFLGLKVSGGYLWDYQLVCWLARCIRRASLDGTSQDWSNNNWSSQVRTGQVRTGQVRTGQVRTGRVRTGQVKSRQVSLLSNLTWDCTKVKMKTYTWNSSVALLSPTCYYSSNVTAWFRWITLKSISQKSKRLTEHRSFLFSPFIFGEN